MPRRSVFAICLICALSVAACRPSAEPEPSLTPPVSATPAASATPEPRSAVLSELSNRVEAREIAQADWQSAIEGQALAVGGGAKTGQEARVRIDISDGTILRIAPNSVFELRELSPEPADPKARLFLEAGTVFVWVTRALGGGSFAVETPVGVAGVRGSLMSVAYDPSAGRMTVTCLEGQCRLSGASGAFTDLDAGEQSEIPGPGQAPTPAQPMDDAQLAEWAQEFPEARNAVATVAAMPRATPTPTLTPRPTPVPQSACDHPYFPLRLGASWTYTSTVRAGEGGAGEVRTLTVTETVTAVQGDLQSATADVGEFTTYACSSNGIIIRRTPSAVGEITNLSGVYLPPAELLTVGYTWNYAYSHGVPGFITTTVQLTQTVMDAEPVVVNGQTYAGLQISVIAVTVQQGLLGLDPRPVENTYTLVLARGVGLVEDRSRRLVSFLLP